MSDAEYDIIAPERQAELRILALRIVSEQLPDDPIEARFTMDRIEELIGFLRTGEWTSRERPRG
jgi:hypothetical protein